MATLQRQITETFLEKLAQSKDMDAARLDELKTLFLGNKKIKVDDLVKIFTLPAGGDLK